MKLPDNVQREFNEWWERQPEGLVPKMRRDINKRELELFLHRILATQDTGGGEVLRYNFENGEMNIRKDGEWVEYDDYKLLATKDTGDKYGNDLRNEYKRGFRDRGRKVDDRK